jgi:hypothetical protein
VRFPDQTPAVAARVDGNNHNAWAEADKHWYATTGEDGSYTWQAIDTGFGGDHYTFTATITDSEGILWIGSASERVLHPLDIPITLAPSYTIELTLPSPVIEGLRATEEGRQILEEFRELKTTLANGLLRAPVRAATWILEGVIRIRARTAGVWQDEWSKLTFGQLIALPQVQALLPPSLRHRLNGLADFRTPNVHNLGAQPAAAEGQLAAAIARDTVVEMFSAPINQPAAPPSTGVPRQGERTGPV